MEKNIKKALYPGTFDPITNGHVGLIKRGLEVFDHIIVGVAKETPKHPVFSLEERLELIKGVFRGEPRITVEIFGGLTVEFAARMKVCAILRGLRAVSDFEYEFQLALMNRRLQRRIQTVFLMTDYQWLYISSTIIKGVISQGGNIQGLVPENVREALIKKFSRGGRHNCPDAHE